MGMRLFSDSCSCPAPRDPDPSKFAIRHLELVGKYTLAVIHYPNCVTYGGNKLCVYQGNVIAELASSKLIDPHFLHASRSPMARFPANIEGMKLARLFCERC